jgi:hypothetical protein
MNRNVEPIVLSYSAHAGARIDEALGHFERTPPAIVAAIGDGRTANGDERPRAGDESPAYEGDYGRGV